MKSAAQDESGLCWSWGAWFIGRAARMPDRSYAGSETNWGTCDALAEKNRAASWSWEAFPCCVRKTWMGKHKTEGYV